MCVLQRLPYILSPYYAALKLAFFKLQQIPDMEKKLEGQKGLYFSVNSFKFVWYKDANVELRELGN